MYYVKRTPMSSSSMQLRHTCMTGWAARRPTATLCGERTAPDLETHTDGPAAGVIRNTDDINAPVAGSWRTAIMSCERRRIRSSVV